MTIVGDELYLKGDANREGSIRLLVVADQNGDGLPDARLQWLVSGAWLDVANLSPIPATSVVRADGLTAQQVFDALGAGVGGAVAASGVSNDSSVTGGTVKDVLNALAAVDLTKADSSATTTALAAKADASATTTALAGKVASTSVGAAGGVAALDGSGKVPAAQVPVSGALNYKGAWNAATNSPALVSSTGTSGDYYVVSTAGTTSLNGIASWAVGDQVVYSGSVWQKITAGQAVNTVFGRLGTVVAAIGDYATSQITGITALGQSLLAGASAAAMRTTLGLGTASTVDVPASGNASGTQAVLGSDTRLPSAALAAGQATATQAGSPATSLTASQAQIGTTAIISPRSTSSKILIVARIDLSKDATTTLRVCTARLWRGAVTSGVQVGTDALSGSSANAGKFQTVLYGIDSPATTASVSYRLSAAGDVNATLTAARYEVEAVELLWGGFDQTTPFLSHGGAAGEGSRSNATRWNDQVSVADFLAVADGTDQRANIQAAIDYAATLGTASSPCEVRGVPGATYSVAKIAGGLTRTFFGPTGGSFTAAYALTLKSNVRLVGLSLKLLAANDCVLLSNLTPAGGDTNISIVGCTIDGNNVVTSDALVRFQQVTGLEIQNTTFKNGYFYGLYVSKCSKVKLGTAGGLLADTIAGNGFQIGGNTFDQCTDVDLGELSGVACTTCPTNVLNSPGNPVYLGCKRFRGRRMHGSGCEGGIKFAPGCSDGLVDKVHFHDSALNSAASLLDQTKKTKNSGCKLEGETGNEITRVLIGEVLSTGCGGRGLVFQFCDGAHVAKYHGYSNGASDAGPDNNRTAVTTPDPDIIVDLGSCKRVSYGAWHSELAGGQGLSTDDQFTGGQIGRLEGGWITVRNCGQSATAQSIGNSSGFSHICGDLHLKLRVVDDQVTKTVGKGFECTVTSAVRGRVEQAELVGISFPLDIRNNLLSFGPVRFDDTAAMFGNITLTAGATTDISSANFRTIHLGSYYTEPVLRLEAMSSAAGALAGAMRATFVNGTATLHHGTAAGTEPVRWTLIGYQQSTVQMV